MKLELTSNGAEALREFAGAMKIAFTNIVDATDSVIQVYQSVENNLGVRRDDFMEMLNYIKRAIEDTTDPIKVLPPKMLEIADRIDEIVTTHNTITR